MTNQRPTIDTSDSPPDDESYDRGLDDLIARCSDVCLEELGNTIREALGTKLERCEMLIITRVTKTDDPWAYGGKTSIIQVPEEVMKTGTEEQKVYEGEKREFYLLNAALDSLKLIQNLKRVALDALRQNAENDAMLGGDVPKAS